MRGRTRVITHVPQIEDLAAAMKNGAERCQRGTGSHRMVGWRRYPLYIVVATKVHAFWTPPALRTIQLHGDEIILLVCSPQEAKWIHTGAGKADDAKSPSGCKRMMTRTNELIQVIPNLYHFCLCSMMVRI